MTQFIVTDTDNNVHHVMGRRDPDGFVGPPDETPISDEWVYRPWQGATNLAAPTPTSIYKWVDDAPQWIETASVEDLKARKNAEINAMRESINSTTFMFKNKAIRCRPLDRSDIDGTNGYVALFGTFPDGWAGGWKAADNSYVAIPTVDEWKAFYKAMVDTGNANFRYAQQLKGRLALAETHEQIAAIKWETPNGQ